MLFAEWVGPITDRQRVLRDAVIDAGPAHWNKTAVVLLERIKKSLEEPITSWNVKKAWVS
ncbi:unnamed protein product [Toxocara canis]|uniref:Ribonuclease HI n=1 Tax=Toxocara canis TaxID=6265 RepID=A0A183VH49_TOXCA|nr:unnamed protein product [Toxocara canis]